jgi:hypothetical protein
MHREAHANNSLQDNYHCFIYFLSCISTAFINSIHRFKFVLSQISAGKSNMSVCSGTWTWVHAVELEFMQWQHIRPARSLPLLIKQAQEAQDDSRNASLTYQGPSSLCLLFGSNWAGSPQILSTLRNEHARFCYVLTLKFFPQGPYKLSPWCRNYAVCAIKFRN